MEYKKLKIADGPDEIIQVLKNTRARKLTQCLPRDDGSRLDVMKAIANNRFITALDLSECVVCKAKLIWSHECSNSRPLMIIPFRACVTIHF